MNTTTEVLKSTATLSLDGLGEEVKQPDSLLVGNFGRYQVVAKMPEADEKGMVDYTKYELGIYAEKVSLWDRVVDFFTGFLSREKHAAMIDFIATGKLQAMEVEDGQTLFSEMEDLDDHYLGARMRLLNKIVKGDTGATNLEKEMACKAFEQLVNELEATEHHGYKKAQKALNACKDML